MSQAPTSVPIKTADGALLRYADLDQIDLHRNHFRLIYNKRGHLKMAILKGRDLAITSLSRAGTSFEQSLACGGAVWALRGVSGSN